MFLTFWWIARWPITNSSPSIPTHTTVTCGLPSGLSVVKWASGPLSITSRTARGILMSLSFDAPVDGRHVADLSPVGRQSPSASAGHEIGLDHCLPGGILDAHAAGWFAHCAVPCVACLAEHRGDRPAEGHQRRRLAVRRQLNVGRNVRGVSAAAFSVNAPLSCKRGWFTRAERYSPPACSPPCEDFKRSNTMYGGLGRARRAGVSAAPKSNGAGIRGSVD